MDKATPTCVPFPAAFAYAKASMRPFKFEGQLILLLQEFNFKHVAAFGKLVRERFISLAWDQFAAALIW